MGKYTVTYTDTFGGELNYGWARSYRFTAPNTASTRMLLRRARVLVGLVGVRGRIHIDEGEYIDWRPIGAHTALIVQWDGNHD